MAIFDNIGKKVFHTYKTAARASGELLEETKLRLSLVNEQGNVENLYQQLGEKVFNLYEQGKTADEDLNDEYMQIQSLKQNIDSIKSRIKELQNIKICPKCSSEIDLEYQYCPGCGAKQSVIEQNDSM